MSYSFIVSCINNDIIVNNSNGSFEELKKKINKFIHASLLLYRLPFVHICYVQIFTCLMSLWGGWEDMHSISIRMVTRIKTLFHHHINARIWICFTWIYTPIVHIYIALDSHNAIASKASIYKLKWSLMRQYVWFMVCMSHADSNTYTHDLVSKLIWRLLLIKSTVVLVKRQSVRRHVATHSMVLQCNYICTYHNIIYHTPSIENA